MKRLFTMVAVVALATFMGSNGATAGIAGTAHDLSYGTGATAEICVYCHTPHSNSSNPAPLWNRSDSLASYTMYSSPSMDMITAGTPQGVSAACLSCHDGTIALDQLADGNNPAGGVPTLGVMGSGAGAFVGTDLSGDHPISITYATTGANSDPNFLATPTPPIKLFATTAGSTTFDQVECASCHNPHDDTTFTPFLRRDNTGSGLCLSCHDL